MIGNISNNPRLSSRDFYADAAIRKLGLDPKKIEHVKPPRS